MAGWLAGWLIPPHAKPGVTFKMKHSVVSMLFNRQT